MILLLLELKYNKKTKLLMKILKSKFIIIIYFTISVLYIIFNKFLPENFILRLTFKSLIIPFLIIFYVLNIKKKFKKSNYIMIIALIFSLLGDIALFLSKKIEIFFIFGLLSFLLTHIFYIFIFFDVPKKYSIIKNKIYLIIPFFVYEILLLIFLYDSLGDMKIPAIIYSITILLMTAIALNRYKNVNTISFKLIFIGAIIFVISDTFVSINVFKTEFLFAEELIMLTYVIAQFLIILGHIKTNITLKIINKK